MRLLALILATFLWSGCRADSQRLAARSAPCAADDEDCQEERQALDATPDDSTSAPATSPPPGTGPGMTNSSGATASTAGDGSLSSPPTGGSGGEGDTGSPSGDSPPQRSGNPHTVRTDARFQPYVTTYINQPDQRVYRYHCPGDSFLIGHESDYHPTERGRRHRFVCQFFIDGWGRQMRKTACVSKKANGEGGEMNFTCPADTLIAGEMGELTGSGDRIHTFECCEMRNADGAKVVFKEAVVAGSEPPRAERICDPAKGFTPDPQDQSRQLAAPGTNRRVNKQHGPLRFRCGNGRLPYKVMSDFWSFGGLTRGKAKPDRQWGYDCCQIASLAPGADGEDAGASGDADGSSGGSGGATTPESGGATSSP